MRTCWIGNRGIVVAERDLIDVLGSGYPALLKKLTLFLPQRIGPVLTAKAYAVELLGGIKVLLLPRCLLPSIEKLFNVEKIYPELARIVCEQTGTLYDNQQILVNYMMSTIFTEPRINNGSACCIINVLAGFGKSFIVGGLIARVKVRTLVILPKKPLALQMVADLSTFLNCRVAMYKNTKSAKPTAPPTAPPTVQPTTPTASPTAQPTKPTKPTKPKSKSTNGLPDVAVVVINTALTMPQDIIDQFSFAVMDECHTLCSKARQDIFRRANLRLMIGLSATTSDRRDKKDPLVHNHMTIGGVIFATDVPGFKYADDTKFIGGVDIVNYHGPPELTKVLVANGMPNVKMMLDQIISDPYRMKLCVIKLKELLEANHNIYVFCAEKDPLSKLHDELTKHFPILAPELAGVKAFNGDTKESDIQTIKNNARVLLSTYGYAGTGVSIIRFTAILFISPQRANMKQIIARILRRGSDPSIERKIVDIVDANIRPLKKQLESRELAYYHYGFETDETDIYYTDLNL